MNAVALSADGRHALSGSVDDTLIWWDVTTGHAVRTLHGHTNGVTSVALNAADGRHALSGSHDETLIWWDLTTGHAVHTLTGTHQLCDCHSSVHRYLAGTHCPAKNTVL